MHKLASQGLTTLLQTLEGRGYRLIGPVLRDGAIVFDEIRSDHDFPRGYVDRQAAGAYRLEQTGSNRYFDFSCGPSSFKRFLHPPEVSLFRVSRKNGELVFESGPAPARPLALIGARACDLAAIAVQDRVLVENDPVYHANRRDLFVLAVQCARSGDLCFCASTQTGPRAGAGFDLALTELEDGFLVEVGTPLGSAVLGEAPHQGAESSDLAEASRLWNEAVDGQRRRLDAERARSGFDPEHPRWKDVAGRCLSCGNCTMVCPTCFCTTTVDGTDERTRVWDSCFSLEYSRLHSGPVRSSTKSRYRQWLSHKLSTWFDQFGTSGCVGCGRCVAWCPAEIDILEEARALCEPSK